MPDRSAQGRSPRSRAFTPEAAGKLDLFPLLRYSHIFSSTVQEVLQHKLLRQATPLRITVSQFRLLQLICVNGKHPIGQVAGILGVSPPAATRNIDKLESLGLVARQRSTGDRRSTLLSTSPSGRALVARYERLKAARLQAALADFRRDEVDKFAGMLRRFSVSILGREPAGDGHCLRCASYIEPGCPVGVARGGCPYQETRTSHWSRTALEGAS